MSENLCIPAKMNCGMSRAGYDAGNLGHCTLTFSAGHNRMSAMYPAELRDTCRQNRSGAITMVNRQLEMIYILMKKGTVTAQELAEHFEVCLPGHGESVHGGDSGVCQ